MAKVAVFNDNIYPYKETFRDELLEIPSKGHIMMEKDEAKLFLGTYSPPMLDSDGNHMEQGFKKLRILGEMKQEQMVVEKFKCNACGLECKTQGDLELHIVAEHVNEMVADTDEEKKLKAEQEKKRKELADADKKKAAAIKASKTTKTGEKKFGL